ncbi:MAG TPA: RNA polymerase sigma-70 factor [Streptosporangiaceae bacterium]|jgi:RNA polymerase sigma-70 factor (ECF subfamily)|nr:RNA polymerase sigma-70 factor [Streptosporangiaceae bacterium]
MAAGPACEFEEQRARLFGLAYRLLGSAADAEDVVQDTYVRWSGADQAAIVAPPAWLARVATNLCLNRLASARARREVYIGPWLPEPVLTSDGTLGPMESAAQRDSVSLALLVLLERLTPAERAVFVLREAFGYGYRDIAAILGLSEVNCRQLHRRVRQRLPAATSRFAPDRGQWRDLVDRFLAAARDGDLLGLERLLAADVTAWADGGGKVVAARRPVLGRARVARYLAGITRFGAGLQISVAEVNGAPAVLGTRAGTLAGVLVLEVSGDQITAVRLMSNPDKLGFASRQVARLSRLSPVIGL